MDNQITIEQFAGRLCALMHKMTGKLLALDRNYLARGPINIPQFFVLHQIADGGECSMSMLARSLGFKSSTITCIVDRLVALGLVKRHSPENNRRQVLTEITPKGARMLEQVRAKRKRAVMDSFSQLSSQECAGYLAVMEKAADHICGAKGHKPASNKNSR